MTPPTKLRYYALGALIGFAWLTLVSMVESVIGFAYPSLQMTDNSATAIIYVVIAVGGLISVGRRYRKWVQKKAK